MYSEEVGISTSAAAVSAPAMAVSTFPVTGHILPLHTVGASRHTQVAKSAVAVGIFRAPACTFWLLQTLQALAPAIDLLPRLAVTILKHCSHATDSVSNRASQA